MDIRRKFGIPFAIRRANPVQDRELNPGEKHMKNLIAKLHIAIMNLKNDEGQDLVEYALLVALIAFAATAGMNTLASSINAAFVSISGKMTLA